MDSNDRLEQLWAEVLKARERANAAFETEDTLRLQIISCLYTGAEAQCAEERHDKAVRELRAAREQFNQARLTLNQALEPS